MSGIGHHVADGEPTARTKYPRGLAEDPGLVAGEVDHAVGDDHVDRVVRQRHVLDRALEELHVLDSGLTLVAGGQIEHLVGHVEAVRLARRADPAGGEQHVDSASGTEIEHRLALVQIGDRARVATAKRRELGGLGERLSVVVFIELGAERVALLVGDSGGVAATRGRPSGARGHGGGRVALPDYPAKSCDSISTSIFCPAPHPQPSACASPQQPDFASGSQQVSCAAGEQQPAAPESTRSSSATRSVPPWPRA